MGAHPAMAAAQTQAAPPNTASQKSASGAFFGAGNAANPNSDSQLGSNTSTISRRSTFLGY